MKYLPVRGFFIFRLTSHSCDPKREINFKRQKKSSKAVSICETWYINNEIGWTFYFKKRQVWQSGLCDLDTCEYKSSNVNLDFPQAASVLRSALDDVVSMTSAEEFQEVCSCLSQIYLFWWWLSGETSLLYSWYGPGFSHSKWSCRKDMLERSNFLPAPPPTS